eukprot:TRINITY_DN8036_c0_g1_i1.p1 TRINITY_DN8036_c0_g1~~TRINITY_DN8036_c0_g1_i1.p1  ORF type:complete len:261 (-),score=35.13 TRINITY_DN8036_c0_g1_i1:247-1029(-)
MRCQQAKQAFFCVSLTILGLTCQTQGEGVEDVECLDRHDTCLFVVALSGTGAYSLVDVLNQHDEVRIQGSNGGLLRTIRSTVGRVLKDSWWGTKYEQALKRGKYGVAWYNPEQRIDFMRGLTALFNAWYRSGAKPDDIIGYIETDFGKNQETYTEFKAEVDMLGELCREPKYIFQLTYDLYKLASTPDWKSHYSNPDPVLKRFFYFFHTYHHQHPQNTMIVSSEEIFTNSTKLYEVFQFIGLEYTPEAFLVGRLGATNPM